MGRRLAAVAVAICGIAFIVSTGGVPISEGPDPVDPDGDVTIDPSSSPYAYLHQETNETVIDLTPANPHLDTGLNSEAITQVGDVVLVHNSHDAPIELWFSDQPDKLTFTHDQKPLEEDTPVTVQPETAVSVGVTVDTTGGIAVTEGDFEIHAKAVDEQSTAPTPVPEPEPQVTVSTPAPEERLITAANPEPGETIKTDFESFILPEEIVRIKAIELYPRVQTDINSEISGVSLAELDRPSNVTTLGGFDLTAETAVSTPAIENTTIKFAVRSEYLDNRSAAIYRQTDAGWDSSPAVPVDRGDEWTIMEATVAGNSTMAVGIEKSPVQIVDYQIEPTTIESQSSVGVTTTVENTGLENESILIPVGTRSEILTTESVTVQPGETVTVKTEITPQAVGTETIYVNGEPVTDIEILEPTEQSAVSLSSGILLFGVMIAILAAVRWMQLLGQE